MKTLEHKEFSVKCGEDLEDSIFGKSNGMILNDDNDKRKESIVVLKSKQVSKDNDTNGNQEHFPSGETHKDEELHHNIILDDKVIRMILHRSKKAEKYGTAVLSMKEAINRHWQELEELRRNKEQEEMKSSKYLKGFVQKVLLDIGDIENEIALLKEAEHVGIRQNKRKASLRRKSSVTMLAYYNAELTPKAWDKYEEIKSSITLIVDSMTVSSENQRGWSKNCHEKKKEIRKDTKRLIKVALAPLPIYRTWTNKSEEKTLRLEKEIVMLRQLLDNAIPEDASSYLNLVSESLRDIEKVVKKLQIGEKRWIEHEEKMIDDLNILRDKMYKTPKTDTKDIISSLILGPLKQSIEKLRQIIE